MQNWHKHATCQSMCTYIIDIHIRETWYHCRTGLDSTQRVQTAHQSFTAEHTPMPNGACQMYRYLKTCKNWDSLHLNFKRIFTLNCRHHKQQVHTACYCTVIWHQSLSQFGTFYQFITGLLSADYFYATHFMQTGTAILLSGYLLSDKCHINLELISLNIVLNDRCSHFWSDVQIFSARK